MGKNTAGVLVLATDIAIDCIVPLVVGHRLGICISILVVLVSTCKEQESDE